MKKNNLIGNFYSQLSKLIEDFRPCNMDFKKKNFLKKIPSEILLFPKEEEIIAKKDLIHEFHINFFLKNTISQVNSQILEKWEFKLKNSFFIEQKSKKLKKKKKIIILTLMKSILVLLNSLPCSKFFKNSQISFKNFKLCSEIFYNNNSKHYLLEKEFKLSGNFYSFQVSYTESFNFKSFFENNGAIEETFDKKKGKYFFDEGYSKNVKST